MNLPPEDQPPSELGRPGVESVGVDAEGRTVVAFNPLQAQVQWPGVLVSSFRFDNLEPTAKFYEQAIAFLDAAKVLCQNAGSKNAAGRDITWSEGSVCYYCVHIASELFLKACIWTHSGEAPKTHDLQKLLSTYTEVLPGPEFQFQLPLAWLQDSSSFERMLDRAPDQLYRYGVGRDGGGSAYTHQFSPDLVFNRVAQFERVWPRAWHALHHRDG
jgi:HEPN domain-containing protein